MQDELVGSTLLDRYQVKNKLGEGGMGAVYLATHITLEKNVALKVLHGEFSRKSDLVERFLQEAKAASKIRHPHVIDITDFGITPQGWVFFAMELLSGQDLHEVLEEHKRAGTKMRWERTKSIFLQVCSALSAAHERGIVHRDLKPENVYLTNEGGREDFVKLLDFGIAKVSQEDGSERKLTKTGMLFGTPEYMSPEQAKGEKADRRVDVYAMGCILYQMIAGRTPFQAENFMSVLTKHLTEEPEDLDPMILRELGAPLELARVIKVALAKDKDERFSTIDDLANAVKGVDDGHTLTTVRNRELRSRGWMWGLGAAVVMCLGAVAFFIIRPPSQPAGAASNESISATVISSSAAVASSQAPLEETVQLIVNTTPGGARIVDVETGALLGTTPFDQPIVKGNDVRELRLELAGHESMPFKVVPTSMRKFDLELSPLESSSSSSAVATSSRRWSRRSRSSKRSSSAKSKKTSSLSSSKASSSSVWVPDRVDPGWKKDGS